MPPTFICHESQNAFEVVAKYISGVVDVNEVKTALVETKGNELFTKCMQHLNSEIPNYQQYLILLVEYTNDIINHSDKDTAESCFSVLVNGLGYVHSVQQNEVINPFVAALTSSADKSEIRLPTLLRLLSVCTDNECCVNLVISILRFCRQTASPTRTWSIALSAFRDKIQIWLAQWAPSKQQQQELLVEVAEAYKGVGDFRNYIRYLTLGLSHAAANDINMQTLAINAFADIVRLPGVFTCDLLELPVVSAIEVDSSSVGAEVVTLVRCMVKGDLPGFQAALTPAVLARLGADVTTEAAMEKARFFALLALASAAEHQDVSFSDVAKALGVESDDVERWLVRAVGLKLLDGKINQVQGSFFVSRSAHPCFGKAQWQIIADKIRSAITFLA
mmetsp:Transcript_7914/g.15398  ORF Transcript_7914/g.15398 Transcript_7914/m.15398 type:complete len:391 (-) Transcript_7914:318-1490(-)|eukprot:CAMPEP_0175064416 /NCGR_PEP_ID=MMETSP0052_2-20121109/15321_1 /TAXON_ID=51329 ORGANISM="Polytomella parva, Strain SAG 63-3" /NCGR_SAMPLE_ID=MMETSP0052_2 /ASSEMBLY_ACC=CAM_ASM_000194 /LENGTH=390 /DNA_ID=CAMNT_0016330765 /DNA_START=45 /DNA_END=1217 /DNA_ORIENTATION=-